MSKRTGVSGSRFLLSCFLTVSIVSSAGSALAEERWAKVFRNSSERYTLYVDRKSLRSMGTVIQLWSLAALDRPEKIDGNLVLSILEFRELDCGSRQERTLSSVFYDGPKATGTVVSSKETPDVRWSEPIPGRGAEVLLGALCE